MDHIQCVHDTVIIGFDETPGVVMQSLNYICDIFFLLDIFVTFNTAIFVDYAKDKNDLITNRRMIARLYIRSWFLVDF